MKFLHRYSNLQPTTKSSTPKRTFPDWRHRRDKCRFILLHSVFFLLKIQKWNARSFQGNSNSLSLAIEKGQLLKGMGPQSSRGHPSREKYPPLLCIHARSPTSEGRPNRGQRCSLFPISHQVRKKDFLPLVIEFLGRENDLHGNKM